MDDIRLRSENPLRPVDWRAQLAAQLATHGRFASPSRYDRATRELVGFHAAQRRSADSNRSDRPERRFNSLAQAFDLREAVDVRLRCTLEALLTGLPFEGIAASIGVGPTAVTSYAETFFDVRDRLGARQFIAHHVIYGSRSRGERDWCDYGWKSVAYVVGAGALREIMAIDQAVNRGQWTSSVRAATKSIVQEKLRRSVENLPDGKSARLIKLSELGAEYERQASESAPIEFQRNIEVFFESLSGAWQVGKPSGPLANFKGMAAELRADEMTCVALGGNLENLEELRALRIPESHACDEDRANASQNSSPSLES